jgi:hypothetical protein
MIEERVNRFSEGGAYKDNFRGESATVFSFELPLFDCVYKLLKLFREVAVYKGIQFIDDKIAEITEIQMIAMFLYAIECCHNNIDTLHTLLIGTLSRRSFYLLWVNSRFNPITLSLQWCDNRLATSVV